MDNVVFGSRKKNNFTTWWFIFMLRIYNNIDNRFWLINMTHKCQDTNALSILFHMFIVITYQREISMDDISNQYFWSEFQILFFILTPKITFFKKIINFMSKRLHIYLAYHTSQQIHERTIINHVWILEIFCQNIRALVTYMDKMLSVIFQSYHLVREFNWSLNNILTFY